MHYNIIGRRILLFIVSFAVPPGGAGGGGGLGPNYARMCVSKSEGHGSLFCFK